MSTRVLSSSSPATETPGSPSRATSALSSVTALPGVGPSRARSLEKLGVRCIRDLLFLLPRGLASASGFATIAEACNSVGREVAVAGIVKRTTLQRFGRRSTFRVTLEDATGTIHALYFNQPWMQKRIAVGDRLELRGRVVDSRGPSLVSPKLGTDEKPLAAPGTVAPRYPAADGVGEEWLRKLCQLAARVHAGEFEEPLPSEVLRERDLIPLPIALRALHQPSSELEFAAARRRIALEPLLSLQTRLFERRRRHAGGRALAATVSDAEHALILARFPFELTAGQRHIADELRADLARTIAMRRLLQGDVGSGKTALGMYACMIAARAGGQSAFLAPTELLAEQHYDGLRSVLSRAGLHGVLLTGSLQAAERRQALAQIESGMADIVFGTHALFGPDVRYRRLVLAVIDEQHRFGVAQRAELLDKGIDVHVLLMSATPIPRTLALSVYGDLETSVLSERPPGRGRVRTRWVRGHDRRRVPQFLGERLADGDQVYWVVPRIGAEGEDVDEAVASGRSSAEVAFERLRTSPLAHHEVELVHGRLAAAERARRLERFRSGAAKILVATTVIEVGVDVPAANVIVIENAERLGLAQLHQLRGRVGRGVRDAWCLLFGKQSSAERLAILEQTNDGFAIAEEDLRRRGMGDLAGLRQAGDPMDGGIDVELLLLARDLVAQHPKVRAAYPDAAQRVFAP
jgi:ATP-dependent DNA helicase RecG